MTQARKKIPRFLRRKFGRASFLANNAKRQKNLRWMRPPQVLIKFCTFIIYADFFTQRKLTHTESKILGIWFASFYRQPFIDAINDFRSLQMTMVAY